MSDTLNFRVRSSSGDEVYNVEAKLAPRLRLTCSCPAGLIGSVCKHRSALLMGDVTSVIEVNPAEVEQLGRTAAESEVGAAMRDLLKLEGEADRLKKAIAAKKKQIGRLMSGA